MIWRSTIQQEGHEFVRYIINKFSDSFKSVDVGIYFDDYVYIVKNGVLSQGTMDIDKAHYEVTPLIRCPRRVDEGDLLVQPHYHEPAALCN